MQKTANPYRTPPLAKPTRNPITRLLFWISKTDSRLACLCTRWARATQAAFGVFVLFTALLALGGMFYTLSNLDVPGAWSLWIAIAWAIWVLFLDREIVGGLQRGAAVVRPMMALALGTIVAVQLQLFVFQNRIDQDLARRYRTDNQTQFEQAEAANTALDKRRIDLQTRLTDLLKQEADWGKVMDDELVGRSKTGRSGRGGVGPVFRNAESQQAAIRLRIQEVRRDLESLERSLPDERQRIQRQFERQEVAKVADFPTRYEALDRVRADSAPLNRMAWFMTLTLILIEMMPAALKFLTPRSDYDHLVSAEMQENILRIDEIGFGSYQIAKDNPTKPQLSVVEKFALARFSPVVEPEQERFEYEKTSTAKPEFNGAATV